MICYRDRTFCRAEDCAAFEKCPHALTDEVRRGAAEWWGGDDAPICVFSQAPDCYQKETGDEAQI